MGRDMARRRRDVVAAGRHHGAGPDSRHRLRSLPRLLCLAPGARLDRRVRRRAGGYPLHRDGAVRAGAHHLVAKDIPASGNDLSAAGSGVSGDFGAAGAGGASPITTFTDASGLIYKTSGQFGIFYKDGDTYKTIENGVPVDYEIDKALWYDYENLTKKIDELANTK